MRMSKKVSLTHVIVAFNTPIALQLEEAGGLVENHSHSYKDHYIKHNRTAKI